MLEGVMLLWFTLTALSLAFVIWDIRSTPESPVLKWGFILVTAYTGPIGAFLYALGCREPLAGAHEQYVATRWRQVLGSTMHCVAGDGVGIIVGAAIGSFLRLAPFTDVALEYVLGFGFGWTIFQALFMRDTAGGSYPRALTKTFVPELLSMNGLMGGMVAVAAVSRAHVPGSTDARSPAFWFIMSMALLAGFLVAYPINWWLVANHLKHGMMTVRRPAPAEAPMAGQMGPTTGHQQQGMEHMAGRDTAQAPPGHGRMTTPTVRPGAIARMTILTFVLFAAGLGVVAVFGRH
jgi:hypothetical protein